MTSPPRGFTPKVSAANIEFMANEIEEGFGGYTSPAISYTNADIGIFADEGVPLARKAATFSHDNSVDAYDFTHVVLLRTNEIDASAGGASLTIYEHQAQPDFTDEYNGWVLTGPEVPAGTGIYAWTGSGGVDGPDYYSLNQSVPTIAQNTDMMLSQIVAVTPLASTATLSDGNEAVFYFDIKHFTYYQV